MRDRPVVGLPTYTTEANWGAWRAPAALLPQSYLAVLTWAGAVPVLLPPTESEFAAQLVDGLDGLMLTGGPDVDPARYGASPHPSADPPSVRDEWELGLLAAAMERDLPTLAICRGLELVNVACGGSLTQHLPDVVGHDGHRVQPGVFATRSMQVQPQTRLAALLGRQLRVPCSHHQAVDRVGNGLVPAARDGEDGTIEALERPASRFLLAVQWHPEEGDDARLFEALVHQAAKETV